MWDLICNFPPERLAAFLVAGLVLNLTPGADVIFATASGIRGGPRAGAMAALGVGLGGFWHVALAAGGLSALIAAHPAALAALRWAGAGYLLYLAFRAWTAPLPDTAGMAQGEKQLRSAIQRGFITNALNPKVILFVLAFLPQFTDPALAPVWQQMVYLGVLFTLTGTCVTMAYGVLAGVLGRSVGQHLGFLNRVAAILFGGLALRLLADQVDW